jgi:phosphoribosylaminoimidazolecarboxamide formyltransferase / IMP cyclohydrolase
MKKIQRALISVFYKDGLANIIQLLHEQGTIIYSTGGTQKFIEDLGIPCVPVETLTNYPSILGGRVKTLHPLVFGGILGIRSHAQHQQEMQQYQIPEIDLVIVDLYPFEETLKEQKTLAATTGTPINEAAIIEKIDIGGPSMIRAAAKNHQDVAVVAAKKEYALLESWLAEQAGSTTLAQRRLLAAKAFEVVANYDVAIAQYFTPAGGDYFVAAAASPKAMRYGENPHQPGTFYGELSQLFTQLHGKELSYNNLVDADAAIQLIGEFGIQHATGEPVTFGIIKHTNVCGVAQRGTVDAAWAAALAGDPESAFGGVLVTNAIVNQATATAISEIFFEVLVAPGYDAEALTILQSKKNRILLQLCALPQNTLQYKSVLNGILVQANDAGNYTDWKEAGGRSSTAAEQADLKLANLIGKHLKSNAIALVKNGQLVGKGCGQTSRIDSLRNAIEKAHQFQFDLNGAVLASDAFFPFDDCVKIAYAAGITAFIQPGGSIRDADSIAYCKQQNLAMVITGMRHFKH